MDRYRRTFTELESVAIKFWPSELSEREAQISIIPLLLKSQDRFIGILSACEQDIDSIFATIEGSRMPANLFLKHLVVLSDFSAEMMKRTSREFSSLFPKKILNYSQNKTPKLYEFREVPNTKLSNDSLHIDGIYLSQNHPLDDLKRDAIALLMFGKAHQTITNEASAILNRCNIGDYIGKTKELSEFIKQRYIWVSQITKGATANNLGQLAQSFVADYITEHLKLPNIEVQPAGRMPKVKHTNRSSSKDTAFDIVVTDQKKYVAIEVSFQVTTNSTYERKAGQVQARFTQIESAGHRIAYVIDGSGNFERSKALETILDYSHCTVAFSPSELDILCQFMKEFFTS